MSEYKMNMDIDDIESYISFNCLKILLLFFNVAFWFFGLLFLLIGVWLETDFENYLKISTQYSACAPFILIGIGTIILFAASLACSCVIKLDTSWLTVYGTFLITMMFTLISSSIYIYEYKNQLIAGVSGGIRHQILTYNANEPLTNGSLIDNLQKDLQCCGQFGQFDWISTTLPKSCCSNSASTCNKSWNIHKEGCARKLRDIINKNLSQIGVIACTFSILPLFGMIVAFALSSMATKMDYEILA